MHEDPQAHLARLNNVWALIPMLAWATACSPSAGTIRGTSQATASNAQPTGSTPGGAPAGTVVDVSTATVPAASFMPSTGTNVVNSIPVDWGSNVLVFDTNMATATIQSKMDAIYDKQASNHFGPERYAYLFKPGRYQVDVQIGFFMTAAGLGINPDDTTITGSVRSKATWFQGNATQNFWRGIENFAVVPTLENNTMVWAVSQGTSLRRLHVRGNINLWDNGWASGGFIGDTKVDGIIDSGTQQQFLSRDCVYNKWQGHNWNMVFVGVQGSPSGSWPTVPYSVVPSTPVIREKPYLAVDAKDNWVVMYPPKKTASTGISWTDPKQAPIPLPITSFYIAHANSDSADTLNAALKKGLHIIFTPGHYELNNSLQVTYRNTILLGLGIATLEPKLGTAAIEVDDVDGVTVAGLVVDAGPLNSTSLLVVGKAGSTQDHSSNPTVLHDVSCRVGGAGAAKTSACLTINSRNVILDNTWLWRADHGDGAGWNSNPSANGIIINGDNVTAYGLFSEHFQAYQTVWNGNNGVMYMYQSEFPYDPPDQTSWRHDNVNGYASYKVGSSVTRHTAVGLGMYGVFHNPVVTENAVESPTTAGINFSHVMTYWIGVAPGSAINHIINGTGGAANAGSQKSQTSY